jgi:hypothetical protein
LDITSAASPAPGGNVFAYTRPLSTATPATQYISEAQASGLQQSVDKINQAYNNLGTALSS